VVGSHGLVTVKADLVGEALQQRGKEDFRETSWASDIEGKREAWLASMKTGCTTSPDGECRVDQSEADASQGRVNKLLGYLVLASHANARKSFCVAEWGGGVERENWIRWTSTEVT
jgi:hypothetical protein